MPRGIIFIVMGVTKSMNQQQTSKGSLNINLNSLTPVKTVLICAILLCAGIAAYLGANINVNVDVQARVQTIENRLDIPVNSSLSAFQKSNTYLVIQHSAGACLMNQSGYLTEFLANQSQIIMDGFGNVSSAGGSVHVQTGSYTASVTVLNNVRFILDEGATGITWTVASGATCIIDDFNSGVFAYYQAGLAYSVFNYSSGNLLVATINSTTVNLNNLVWNGLNRTDTIASPTGAYNYIITTNGAGNFFAKNGTDGTVLQNTNISAVVNSEIGNLTVVGSSGGRILMKAGTYNFTAPIIMKQHIWIEGEGPSITILQLADNANCNLFEYKNSSTNVLAEIYSMTITGNSGMNTQGSGIYIEPTAGGTFWDLSLHDVYITHFAQYGIYTSQFWGYSFFDVISEYNLLDGIHVTGGSSGHMIGSKFMLNGQCGLNMTGGGYLDWTDDDFRQNGYHGVWLNGSTCSFISCHFIQNSASANNTYDGIFLYGTAASYTRIISCEFNGKNGNNFEHYGVAIAAASVAETLVEDNTFYGYGAAPLVDYGTGSRIHYNHGWNTEGNGAATFPSGSVSYSFPHGLNGTPMNVGINWQSDLGGRGFYWSANSTYITVTLTQPAVLPNVALGITPTTTAWGVAPTSLANSTDGDWTTSTTNGTTNATGSQVIGTLDYNLGATYTCEVFTKVGLLVNQTCTLTGYWYYSNDGTNWNYNTATGAFQRVNPTSELIVDSQVECVSARYVRLSLSASVAANCTVCVYEVAMFNMTPATAASANYDFTWSAKLGS
jgi:hypothetical protein